MRYLRTSSGQEVIDFSFFFEVFPFLSVLFGMVYFFVVSWAGLRIERCIDKIPI